MFLHAPLTRPFILFSGIAFLTACGGGGSDSDSDQGSTALQLDPANYGGTPVSIRQSSDIEGVGQLYSDAQEVQDLIEEVDLRLYSINYGRSGTFEPDICAVSNGNLEYSDTADSTQYRFTDCVVPGYGEPIRLDGTVTNEVTFFEKEQKVEIKDSYDLTGSIGDPAMQLGVVGSETVTGISRDGSRLDLTVTSPSMEYLIGDRYVAIRDNQVEVTQSSSGRHTVNMKSDLVSSSLGGYVTMSTPEALEYISLDDCPTKGRILISGDGTMDTRYGQSSGNGRGVEILLNGSVVEYVDSCDSELPGFGV